MRRRTVESFGSFPASSWADAFEEELAEATRVRLASGFMDRRGAEKLVETLKLAAPNAHVDVLLGLAGVFGPDVIDVLESHPRVVVRASRLSAFIPFVAEEPSVAFAAAQLKVRRNLTVNPTLETQPRSRRARPFLRACDGRLCMQTSAYRPTTDEEDPG